MGWGYGENPDGKEVGYLVEDICNHPGCNKKIDRGLAYVCGVMHGEDEYSCDGYFCDKHQRVVEFEEEHCNEVTSCFSVCENCLKRLYETFEYDEEKDIFGKEKE